MSCETFASDQALLVYECCECNFFLAGLETVCVCVCELMYRLLGNVWTFLTSVNSAGVCVCDSVLGLG